VNGQNIQLPVTKRNSLEAQRSARIGPTNLLVKILFKPMIFTLIYNMGEISLENVDKSLTLCIPMSMT